MTEHNYMGERIRDCTAMASRGQCPGTGKGWHIQTYHEPTGQPWAEEETPWYPSLAAARAAIKAEHEG